MKFKVAENLPIQCVDQLPEGGQDALSVNEQGLSGAADPRIAEVCTAEGRVLVSLDLDFADIRTYPPSAGAGIIILVLLQISWEKMPGSPSERSSVHPGIRRLCA